MESQKTLNQFCRLYEPNLTKLFGKCAWSLIVKGGLKGLGKATTCVSPELRLKSSVTRMQTTLLYRSHSK